MYWSENPTCTNFPESGSGKHFQASGMRAIDFLHEITPRNMILREKFQNCSIFASIHTSISLNQDQGSIFTLRECAQSIPRMKLTPEIWFWERNFKNFRFSLQYTHLFSWIRVKEAFRECAQSILIFWFYVYIGCFGKKLFSENSPFFVLPL